MMHHTDPTPPNPYYPQHNHFPPNPNPNPEPYPNPNPNPASSASAPPLSSSFSPPEYQSYPYYPQNTPTAPSFPPYDHAAPSYYPYDQSPIPPAPPGPNFDNYGGYADQNNTTAYGGVEGDVDVYEGAYRYQGGAHGEPYGARGTAGLTSSSSRSEVLFDDYGRPINVSGGGGGGGGGGDHGGGKGSRVVRARPKEDTEEEEGGKSGVLKFRVKVLAEGSGQSDLDVLCQIGLDGIRMLDPATSRTLRVYPFESVTRWEVLDSYIFAFWAKMPVDIEPKRIRLKSNSYTTNTILDTVTAASVQLKEIAEGKDPNSSRTSEQPGEKKKGFGDWMNMMKPPNEEKDHWVPDEAVNKCVSCDTNFNAFVRKHHCRNCGEIFCDKCTQGRTPLTLDEEAPPVRVCDRCMAEVTQRLENAKEAANRSGKFLSHEDLARRLKEELSRNSKASSGSKYEGAQTHKREVACPICTVHLQVEVPSSGSETIECSVCQHPFLISAN